MQLRQQHITAIVIVSALALWQASGLLKSAPVPEESSAADNLTAVRVGVFDQENFTATLSIRGRTEAIRKVELRSKIDGQVVATPPEKGDRVKAGDTICRIAIDSRAARLAEAKALAKQRELEASASKRLAEKGHRSETQAAAAQAQLDAARALVTQMQIDLENTEIRAPFDGIVNERLVETGAYLQQGDPCATLVQDNPILVVGNVSEQDVSSITKGQSGRVLFTDGSETTGTIRYISSVANEQTRTFRVELLVDNTDAFLKDGITANVLIPVGDTQAHLISSAILVLDDAGVVGVRTLADNNLVRFKPIQILGDGPEGTWVQGLASREQIITVGHQYVEEGQKVRPDFGNQNAGSR